MIQAVSNTERRSNLAAQRIPRFAAGLLMKLQRGVNLSVQDIRLLYGEYRQLHRSRRPFRSTIDRLEAPVSGYSSINAEVDLLVRLENPEGLDRREAVRCLYSLWVLVSAQ